MNDNNHKKQKPRTRHFNKKLNRGLPIPDDKSVLVVPLGGVGYIGMNWTLYGHAGKWLLVDAGSNFAPRDLSIVEAIFPDPVILNTIRDRLVGLVVTHAHEDHIGAIHRLWPGIQCPIYATPFAKMALESRFEERNTLKYVKIRKFEPGARFGVGPFSVQTIRMTHSAPECVSLAISTSAGTVFHTGDWKLDPMPMIGKPTDEEAIVRLGKKGVLAMVCDSTNATRPFNLSSEFDVYQGFKQAFRDAPGMVAVSCFATNVARVASVLRAAAASNRVVGIAGRSLVRYEAIARHLGMLDGVPEPLASVTHLRGLPRNEMVLLCTGAQGEANAALSKLSTGEDWKLPKIEPGDAIIHSARVIPGNEEYLEAAFDRLRDQGAEILEREWKGHPLHVTGHATSGEIARMYDMVRPKISFPVHGNPEHLEAHAGIARAAGVRNVVVPEQGAVYSVNAGGVRKLAKIDVRLKAELGGYEHRKVHWDETALRALQERMRLAKLESAAPTLVAAASIPPQVAAQASMPRF
jgi:ribonuclease J